MVFGRILITAAAFSALTAAAQAATVPFTEDFTADNAGWKDAASLDLTYVASGGPDGSSYVSTVFDFSNQGVGATPTLLRGQDNFDASGDAFVGNWIAEGVSEVTAFIRHSAPFPLNFFVRAASSINFPGGVALDFVPVLPNTWTQLTFDVGAASAQFISFEGSDYNTVFSNIGNVQFGLQVNSNLAGLPVPITFDLDRPTITPEPASLGLFATGAFGMLWRRR